MKKKLLKINLLIIIILLYTSTTSLSEQLFDRHSWSGWRRTVRMLGSMTTGPLRLRMSYWPQESDVRFFDYIVRGTPEWVGAAPRHTVAASNDTLDAGDATMEMTFQTRWTMLIDGSARVIGGDLQGPWMLRDQWEIFAGEVVWMTFVWDRSDVTYRWRMVVDIGDGRISESYYGIPNEHSNFDIGLELHTRIETVAPYVFENPNLRRSLGEDIDWTYGIRARWGHTTSNIIPDLGEIRITSLIEGTDPVLSDNLSTYTRIGTSEHTYEIRDDHSLSPEYPFDNTFTTTTRTITVYTPAAPILRKQYAPTADSALIGDIYNPLLPLPCGGESGWTNQPLDISIDPDTIIGTFDTQLTLPDFSITATNAIATRSNYHIESPNTLGTPVSGILTAVGDASNLLSGVVNGLVKIDKTPPIPAATHVSGYDFADDSTDALSGISLTRPSQIAFSAPSGPQPTPGDFHTFDAIPTMPDGTYDVWVCSTYFIAASVRTSSF